MPTKLTSVLLFFFTISFFSQSTISLSGQINQHENKAPIEAATVYLSKVNDSTLIDYMITDNSGKFNFNVKKTYQPTYLKIVATGFSDKKIEIKSLENNNNFGAIFLQTEIKSLDEITIKKETPPVRIKKDTLEFNVASFKVRPYSNVETLLKQLPGVEFDINGKITVNGKEVNQILVNGKPFFDKDGKIALQSLPSELIKKVQITDTKSRKEELAGTSATNNNASINLTIDKDKNKGFFGKFTGGFGSNNRYESSGLVNYFKNKQKISALASSNNINASGFSMDEIFDNMSGGRNASFAPDLGNFGFSEAGNGGRGITQTNLFGINYSDNFKDKLDSNLSYSYSENHTNNNNKTKTESLLPTNRFFTKQNAITNTDKQAHRINTQFEIKIDSTTTLSIRPLFSSSKSTNFNTSFETSTDENLSLLNENKNNSKNISHNTAFENEIEFNKQFKRKGRMISLSFTNENEINKSEATNKSETLFYQGSQPDDIRNQQIRNTNKTNVYFSEIEYSEPLKDSIILKIGSKLNYLERIKDQQVYDFETLTQNYSLKNELISNFLTQNKQTITPFTALAIQKKKYWINFNLGTAITNFKNKSYYNFVTTQLNKDFVFPFAQINGNYNFNATKSVSFRYGLDVNFPDAFQFLPVANLANPLNTITGNPNLKPNKTNSFNLSFRNFKTGKKQGFNLNVNANFNENPIVSTSFFDANRKRNTTYENVKSTYRLSGGGNYNKTIKNEAHVFKFRIGGNLNRNFNRGITNLQNYTSKTVSFSPRLNFTYEYGELLTINPTYNINFVSTKYTNYVIDAAKNTTHTINLQTTNYWLKNWVFGNDYGYTYNSNISDGFKKDFYLWNTSLAFNFYNKKCMAKVKVYDILDQNQNATRNISATSIRDEENIVLQRYIMFSFTFKIEKFAGKEKQKKNRFQI